MENHNAQLIPGSSFRRNEVNEKNFGEYLDDKYSSDFSMNFPSRSIDQRGLSDRMAAKLFRFKMGDSVRLTRKSTKKSREKKVGEKVSDVGTYTRETYTIHLAKLKSTKDGSLVPGSF